VRASRSDRSAQLRRLREVRCDEASQRREVGFGMTMVDYQMWVTRGRTPTVQHIYPDCKHFGGFAPPRAATVEETRTLLTCEECRRRAHLFRRQAEGGNSSAPVKER
jgi:hypothetical protein